MAGDSSLATLPTSLLPSFFPLLQLIRPLLLWKSAPIPGPELLFKWAPFDVVYAPTHKEKNVVGIYQGKSFCLFLGRVSLLSPGSLWSDREECTIIISVSVWKWYVAHKKREWMEKIFVPEKYQRKCCRRRSIWSLKNEWKVSRLGLGGGEREGAYSTDRLCDPKALIRKPRGAFRRRGSSLFSFRKSKR